MKIPASTILSFVTGRLYSDLSPTELFADMMEVVTDGKSTHTAQLPGLRAKFSSSILSQCPPQFQDVCRDWVHTPNWRERVELIDEAFGCIEILRA